MKGSLCMVGVIPNEKRVFYYGIDHGLHIEIIDRRNKDQKHLVVLVDSQGQPVTIPEGSTFQYVASDYGTDLLENHIRKLDRNAHQEAPVG